MSAHPCARFFSFYNFSSFEARASYFSMTSHLDIEDPIQRRRLTVAHRGPPRCKIERGKRDRRRSFSDLIIGRGAFRSGSTSHDSYYDYDRPGDTCTTTHHALLPGLLAESGEARGPTVSSSMQPCWPGRSKGTLSAMGTPMRPLPPFSSLAGS